MAGTPIDFVLNMAGLSAAEIATLEKSAPGVAALMHAAVEAKQTIEEAQALYEAAKPLLARAAALYEKAKPLISQALAELPTLDADAQIIVGVLMKGRPPDTSLGTQGGGAIGS